MTTLGTGSNNNKNRNRKQSNKSQQISPFVDNFKLNIFIRSPVIIFPISPTSHEVVVFHLGHMLLNNHNHSTDIIMSGPMNSNKNVSNGGLKYSPAGASSIMNSTGTSSTSAYSYNAEIRDISVYSLDCSRNIQQFEEFFPDYTEMPMSEVYYCDTFGVPILQKTVIEIVLEKKVLMSSFMDSSTGMSNKRPLSSRLSQSPQPPSQANAASQPTSGKTSTSSIASSQDDSVLIDGLNIISTVNSIDPFRPPKKFSIR